MLQFKLFISYAHTDFDPVPGFNDSRAGLILQMIKRELGCQSSRARFKILRDVEVFQPSQNFRDMIAENIAESHMAIVFLSQHYWDSEECEKELRQLGKLKKPLMLVELEDVPFRDNRVDDLRESIKDILHVAFWGIEDQRTVKYGSPLPYLDDSAYRKKYWDALDLIYSGIKARAQSVIGADQADAEDRASRHHMVLMACPASDTRPEVRQLIEEIEKQGYSVLPFEPGLEVSDKDAFESAMTNALSRCNVYVQLLGGLPGKKVPGTEAGIVQKQLEIAVKTEKPKHVWMRSDFDIAECDQNHAAFLNEIALGSHRGSFVEFKDYLLKKLKDVAKQGEVAQRRQQRAEQQPESDRAVPAIGIDAAQPDYDLALKLSDAFGKYANVAVLENDIDGPALADAMADNDAIVLAYGKSAEGWKRAQAHFRIIRRQNADARAKRLELAVGNGAPPNAPPCPRGPDVQIISISDEVDTAAMLGFLSRLGVAASQTEAAR